MNPENSKSRASAQERLLASIDLIDASQACALLHIETDAADTFIADMLRRRAILSVVGGGAIMFPLFQFDIENRRIFNVIHGVLSLRPASFSNMRLCYWLTRAHSDFCAPPADHFGKEDAAIVAAFKRAIEPVVDG